MYNSKYYWAWCLFYDTRPDKQGKVTKLIQGPYEHTADGLMKLNYDTTKLYPQGDWKVAELDTRDRAKATAELRYVIGHAESNLGLALQRMYKRPVGRAIPEESPRERERLEEY